jgi:hypothetical protein
MIGVTSLLIIAPFVLWGVLYVAVRKWSLDLRPLIPRFRVFRWVAWSCGLLLYVGYFLGAHYPWGFPIAVVTFSIGLSFPESWLKRQYAPVDSIA